VKCADVRISYGGQTTQIRQLADFTSLLTKGLYESKTNYALADDPLEMP
jgi:hypothetical protein